MKKFFVVFVTLLSITFADICVMSKGGNVCYAAQQVRGGGSYLATNQTVSVYTESGHPKGRFTIYMHSGKKYIKFNNTWVCIQGKSRFSFQGNWYVIK